MGDFPKTLYKFRDWTNPFHKEVLTKRTLYLASPKDFNDPFDCRISKNYLSLSDPKKMEKYQKMVLSRQVPKIIEEGRDLKDSLLEIRKRLSDLPKFQKEGEKIYFESQDKHYGVISFSTVWDNILLWSHYANNHRGFCIGLSEKKLRDSNRFGVGGIVNYEKKYPFIDPSDEFMMENYLTETHTKAKDWEYENEFRLTKLFFPNVPSNKDRLVTFENDAITEVILGLRISDYDKKEILSSLPNKSIPVYQIQQIPFEFKIERKRIN